MKISENGDTVKVHYTGKLKEGDHLVLAAFGSGFTWASAIIKW